MRPIVLLASIFLAVVILLRAEDKPAKLADLNIYGDSLTIEGVWRPDNLNENIMRRTCLPRQKSSFPK